MTVEEFKEKLKEFESQVVISPLSESEVTSIESVLERKLPAYYRKFLLTIGLKQDVVWGLNDRIRDFNPLTDFLPDGQSKNFFRFGHNGGEDYWLLRSDDPDDRTIYEFDYYCDLKIKSLGKTFDDLLDEAIQQLNENKNTLTNNAQKVWAVQFSINTDDVNNIIDSLKKEFDCSLSKNIRKVRVSPAGVICSEGKLKLEGSEVLITKQEYSGWETASYSFDWKESLDTMKGNSLIERIKNRMKNDDLSITLIDYGIVELD